ncbi:MAG: mechanosensitive ion channel domain-containing protein [Gemmatimonadaceae bacterium]
MLKWTRFVAASAGFLLLPAAAISQVATDTGRLSAPQQDELAVGQSKVDVRPGARDEDIRSRLERVLEATEWFTNPTVRVEEGVVFLGGEAPSEDLRRWAGDLARNTEDVVAVANRIEVRERSPWDFSRASSGLRTFWRDVQRVLPMLLFGAVVLGLFLGASILAARLSQGLLADRVKPRLLRRVIARGIGLLVFLLGFYVLLRILGLTQLALTVLGGTGLIGLVLGIAFRDITENFLASIFLSMQRPFRTGDLIEVAEITGYVQQLNMRTTVVMTLDGIVVQIPNAAVYKSNIRNFTTNGNRREVFEVGIGYDDTISDAQEIAMSVLLDHPAVLKDPEPWVLVNDLRASTVNLRVYFWLDGSRHSWLKVRSSVIRLVKRAFQERGISIPDEAREILFPRGVHVTLEKPEDDGGPGEGERKAKKPDAERIDDSTAASTRAEGGLNSEAEVIREQARQAQPVEPEENLLQDESGSTSPDK